MTAARERLLCVALVVLVVGCTAGAGDDADPPAAPGSAGVDAAPATSATTPRPACPSPTLARSDARVQDASLREISGAVASPTGPDHVWVHQDSGNPPVLTLLDLDGATVASWTVTGVEARDWEDLAAVADPPTLFVGDIGDNQAARDDLTVIRLAEPASGSSGAVEPEAVLQLTVPEPADAEALLVDPVTGDLLILTKDLRGDAELLRAGGAAWSDGATPVTMERVGTLSLGPLSPVLAADVASDGSAVVLRTPSRVLWWARHADETLAEAMLARTPCPLPSVLDPFGEAVALLPDGGYLLVGEDERARLHRAVAPATANG